MYRMRYTDAITPDAQKRIYWTMVSVDACISRRANCTGQNALSPTKWLKPASKLENKSNETDRKTAGTSERCRRNFFWRSAHSFGSVDGLDACGDEVAS